MKNNVLFFRDWYEAIKDFSPDERLNAYDAIMQYAFEGIAPTDKFIKAATALMLKAIDRDTSKYEMVSRKRSEAASKRWNESKSSNKVHDDALDTSATLAGDKEKVTEKEKETDKVKGKGKTINYPYRDIVALWNEICTSLPSVKSLNDNRRKKIRLRLDEWGDSEKWIDTARELFAKVEASDFLSGRSGRWNGCSFDWFFTNSENWVKVSEGNYRNKSEMHGAASCLGVDERIENGRRTYGSGRATIPMDAPPRPSESHVWSAESNTWVTGV